MATEQIGSLIPTAIPGYEDAADIQAALRAYHYGSYDYSTANTNPVNLVSPSIAKTIYDIESAITTLENKPSGGGIVDADEPVPGDFPDNEIPEGYIWVDSNGTLGGAPISATSVYTNEAPTVDLTSGLIWVDKDTSVTFDNPYIPQSIIGAKGDLVVGSAADLVTILPAGTTGQVLKVNSATTSGLEWSTDLSYSTPTIGSTTITSGATITTISGLTLSAPALTGTTTIQQILEKATVSATAANGTISYDLLTNGAVTYYTSNASGNWTLNVRGSSSTSLDSVMTTGQSLTFAFFVTNGATAYYQNGFQIDGNAVTPKWQNGIAPSAGNINSIDIYTITIMKTGSATFTAFAAQTKFA